MIGDTSQSAADDKPGGIDLEPQQASETETAIRQGHEVEEIVRMAKEGDFRLLLLGYHGHGGIFGRIRSRKGGQIGRAHV